MTAPMIRFTSKALVSALIVATLYMPVLGSFTGTVAAAQAVQNTTTTYAYDAMGNVTKVTDPLNRSSTFIYDYFGRLTSRTDPAPNPGQALNVTRQAADPLDQIGMVQDPLGMLTYHWTNGFEQRTQTQSPDTGITGMTYDSGGNLLTRTDARGKVTTFSYDALNRMTRIAYATGVASVFDYDGGAGGTANDIGHLTKVSDESGQTNFSYDGQGRLLSQVQLASAPGGATVALAVRYAYGTAGSGLGKVSGLTYPSGNRINYSYDAAGRVQAITLNPGDGAGGTNTATTTVLLSEIAYNAVGAVLSWNWGNHSAATPNSYVRTYDLDGRLTSYPLGSPAADGLVRTLTYNAASNITAMTHTGAADAAGFDQTITYNDLNRIVAYATPTVSLGYTYDANGSRTQLRIGAASYNNAISSNSNRLSSTAGPAPAKSNSFDAAGNMLGDGTVSYVYGDHGRMKRSTRAAVATDYLYNGLGQRVSKAGAAVSGGVAFLAYDATGKILGEYETAAATPIAETVYLGTTPVALLSGGAVRYVYADHIDTPRVLANSSDNVIVWRWDQADPFGAAAPNENPKGVGAVTYNLRFPGQLFDKENNLNYNYYRDYDPQTGRYIQSDPIGLKGGINTYGYVGANPVSKFDPLGLQEGSLSPGRGTLPGPFDVFVPGTQANNYFVSSVWNLFKKRPAEASSFPPGVWPGDKGADEWGRRNGHGAKEGRGRFHGIKQDCPGSKPTDVYGVNPETGDVYDPEGEVVGNLEDAKRK